jgi:hypothetical protein
MAGMFSTSGANAVLNGTAIPGTLYVKLFTGNPGASAASNAAGNTARQSFTRSTSTTGTNSNAAALTWVNVSTSETYSHFAAFDDPTAGNPWIIGTVTASAVTSGDTFEIATGDLDLTLTIWS